MTPNEKRWRQKLGSLRGQATRWEIRLETVTLPRAVAEMEAISNRVNKEIDSWAAFAEKVERFAAFSKKEQARWMRQDTRQRAKDAERKANWEEYKKARAPMTRAEYLAEAKRLHPDHGGSHEAMSALNARYERSKQ